MVGSLRTVDMELERLMADRWPVVLEAFGLVEALEDLAERTEADGTVEVGLEVQGAAGRPRPEIERAAWRVAQLAIDNAVRHAGTVGRRERRVRVREAGRVRDRRPLRVAGTRLSRPGLRSRSRFWVFIA